MSLSLLCSVVKLFNLKLISSARMHAGGGDKDARDLQDMAREGQLRRGKEVTHPRDVGGFERHTKVWGCVVTKA